MTAWRPLLSFLVLGGLAFGLYLWVREPDSVYQEPDRVVTVSADRIAGLVELWEKRWGRRPTEEELRNVVDGVVRNEILSREAIALGLDRDDPVVRRRLAQKMDFLARDLTPLPEPTEEELQAYMTENLDRYREPPRISFSHVYFSPDRRGESLEEDVRKALAGPDPGPGDPIMISPDQVRLSPREIADRFGSEFAKDLMGIEPGAWHGPVASAYGLHAVKVTERIEGRVPALAEVKREVRRDYDAERREKADRTFYELLSSRYRIDIDEAALEEALR